MVRKSKPKLVVRMTVDHDWPVPGKRAWLSFKSGREYPLTQKQAGDMAGTYEVVSGNR